MTTLFLRSLEGIRRLVLCSGKVYYELDEERKKVGAKDIAICRVEQLCPFPYDVIQRELKRYPRLLVKFINKMHIILIPKEYEATNLNKYMLISIFKFITFKIASHLVKKLSNPLPNLGGMRKNFIRIFRSTSKSLRIDRGWDQRKVELFFDLNLEDSMNSDLKNEFGGGKASSPPLMSECSYRAMTYWMSNVELSS
ncbi:2-oxoglutarate dehydrogenase [Nymphaea thermarum]|nr:2-oxoglutarate dehydrogenase [Nymphaea thermarum]